MTQIPSNERPGDGTRGEGELDWSQWRAMAPPSEFAQKLSAEVFRARAEEPRRRRLGVWAGFLVAALLVSASAAAWGVVERDVSKLSFSATEESRSAYDYPIREMHFSLLQRALEAEPDRPAPRAPKKAPGAVIRSTSSETKQAPPIRLMHFPRCTCDSVAVICGCSD